MVILVGICLAVALLYFWLLGHWFARVVVFLMLAPVFGIGLGALMAPSGGAYLGLVLGAVAAWPVSGIPLYYWRWQYRRLTVG